jgi:DNA polymerase (family 10)
MSTPESMDFPALPRVACSATTLSLARAVRPNGRRLGRYDRPADDRLSNSSLAERLEAFSLLLELAGASPFGARAYRRAAEVIRASPAPVAELVRTGRVRELTGIGRGIEARLRELVETGEIAELAALERTVSPEALGFARFLGIGVQQALEISRALGISSAEDMRAAILDGRVETVRGIGPKTAARLRNALEAGAPAEGRRPLLLSTAWALSASVATALEGEVAGDPRRFRDLCERLVVVCRGEDVEPVVDRFAALPEIVAIAGRDAAGAVGVTVEGVPIELVVAEPGRFGTELLRATGSRAYVDALGPLPDGPDEHEVYEELGVPWCPPELREEPFRGGPPALVELADVRGDLHCHTTWSDGRASVLEMGLAARDRGYEYVAICDHTPSVGVVPGIDAEGLRRQGEEIDVANEQLAPFRILRGVECDILADGSLDLPDSVLGTLDWVMASVHAGQRQSRELMTRRVVDAMRNPHVSAISHPTGRLLTRRPANALDVERVIEVALETGTALEVNGLPPRLDLKGEHVRLAVDAGVSIVVSTDAHSVGGLDNMTFAVGTARRGWARSADVVNTRPLDLLPSCSS